MRRRLLWLAVIGALIGGGAWGGKLWVAGKLQEKLIASGAVAGLRVEVQATEISLLGSLQVRRLRAFRADDTEAFAWQLATVRWSWLDVARGRRRPTALELEQPRLDTRVIDGQPRELNRWLRVAKRQLRRGARDRSAAGAGSKRPFKVPALVVNGGVLRVQVIRKFSALAPGGLLLRDFKIAIGPDGVGTAMTRLVHPVEVAWSGTVEPGPDRKPWIALSAAKPLQCPVPAAVAERAGIDTVRIGGAGFNGTDGPYLTNVVALAAGRKVVEISRIAASVVGEPEAIASAVVLHPAAWLTDERAKWAPQEWRKWLGDAALSVQITTVTARKLLARGGDRVELDCSDIAVSGASGGLRGRAHNVRLSAAIERLKSLDLRAIRADVQRCGAELDADNAVVQRLPGVARLARSLPERLTKAQARAESFNKRAGANKPGWPNPNPQPRRFRRGRSTRKRARLQQKRQARMAAARGKTGSGAEERSKGRQHSERQEDEDSDPDDDRDDGDDEAANGDDRRSDKTSDKTSGKPRRVGRTGARAAAAGILTRRSPKIAKAKRASEQADRALQEAEAALARTVARREKVLRALQAAIASEDRGRIRKLRKSSARWKRILARYVAARDRAARRQKGAVARFRALLTTKAPATTTETTPQARLDAIARKSLPPRKRPRRRDTNELPYTKRFVAPLQRLHQQLAIELDGRLVAASRALAKMPEVRISDAAVTVRGKKGKAWQLEVMVKRATSLPEQVGHRLATATAVVKLDGQHALTANLALDRDDKGGALRGDAALDGVLAPLAAGLQPVGVGPDASVHVQGELLFGGGLQAQAQVETEDLGVDWWRFAPGPVTDLRTSSTWVLRAGANPAELLIATPRFAVGDLHLRGSLHLDDLHREATADLHVSMPRQDATAAAASIPRSLLPTIGDIQAVGEVGWWVDLHVNIPHPWFSELSFLLDDKDCKITSMGKVDVLAIAGNFERRVNEDGTILDDVSIGPASSSWTPLSQMPRWVPYAMTTTEDGSFWAHRGLNEFLLNRAVRLDLHYGRFVYGGSTLTQQLVKNLYMTRSKFLARKLEEMLIVWSMERNVKKTRILEVYTNAVEFGPNLYGVTRGGRHYFDKKPSQLTPIEAAFLGSIKPCPRCADYAFRAKKYRPWYQKRVLQILTRMLHYNVITQEQYDREMNTVPRFVGWPPELLAKRFSWPIPEVNKPNRFDNNGDKRKSRK